LLSTAAAARAFSWQNSTGLAVQAASATESL
jgi:hypothetical protein